MNRYSAILLAFLCILTSFRSQTKGRMNSDKSGTIQNDSISRNDITEISFGYYNGMSSKYKGYRINSKRIKSIGFSKESYKIFINKLRHNRDLSFGKFNNYAGSDSVFYNVLENIPAALFNDSCNNVFGHPDEYDQGGVFFEMKYINVRRRFLFDRSSVNISDTSIIAFSNLIYKQYLILEKTDKK